MLYQQLIPFYCWVVFHWITNPLPVMDPWVIPIRAIRNKVAMQMWVPVFMWIYVFIFLGYILPKSRMAGSFGRCTPTFNSLTKQCQTSAKAVVSFYTHTSSVRVLVLTGTWYGQSFSFKPYVDMWCYFTMVISCIFLISLRTWWPIGISYFWSVYSNISSFLLCYFASCYDVVHVLYLI